MLRCRGWRLRGEACLSLSLPLAAVNPDAGVRRSLAQPSTFLPIKGLHIGLGCKLRTTFIVIIVIVIVIVILNVIVILIVIVIILLILI